MSKPVPQLWLNDSRGIYIPRDFATSFGSCRAERVLGVLPEEWQILEAGPDHDSYWDTWNDVQENATVKDDKGTFYTLYQDGDLWLIPEGMEWSEKTGFFIWPEDGEKNG